MVYININHGCSIPDLAKKNLNEQKFAGKAVQLVYWNFS
jgi:hypothetical protein